MPEDPATATSRADWTSFESRMLRRRHSRCLLAADLALDDGLADAARTALAEARTIDASSPELAELERRLAALERHRPSQPVSTPVLLAQETPRWGRRVRVTMGAFALVLAGFLAWNASQIWNPSAGHAELSPPPPSTVPPSISEPVRAANRVQLKRELVIARPHVPADDQNLLNTRAPAILTTDAGPAMGSGLPIQGGIHDLGTSIPPDLPPSLERQAPAPDPGPEDRSAVVAANSNPTLRPAADGGVTDDGSRQGQRAPTPDAIAALDRRGSDSDWSIAGRDPSLSRTLPVTPPSAGAASPASEPAAPDLRAATAAVESDTVRGVLSRYEAAYSGLDAQAASAVWPSVNRVALARAFQGLVFQQVSLGACDVTVSGPSAHASCTGTTRWAPRIGGGQRTESRRWSFDLRKSEGNWVIERALTH